MNKPVQYGVFLGDSMIFIGSREQICEFFQVSSKSFYEFVRRKMRVKGKYLIKRLGLYSQLKKPDELPKIKTQKELDIEYIISEFKRSNNFTHNTITDFDPVPYFPDLYELGYDCKISGIYSNTDGGLVTNQHRTKDVHYIVEYVNI